MEGQSKTPTIMVLGQTGAGKSKFIALVAESAEPALTIKPIASGGLFSYTQTVQDFEMKKRGISVRVVDTPGFNDTSDLDEKHMEGIVEWLRKEPQNNVLSILYLQDIKHPELPSDNFMIGPQKILPRLPPDASIDVVTTNWTPDKHSKQFRKEVEAERTLQTTLNQFGKVRSTNRFSFTGDSGWSIIITIMEESTSTKRKLITQGELATALEQTLPKKADKKEAESKKKGKEAKSKKEKKEPKPGLFSRLFGRR